MNDKLLLQRMATVLNRVEAAKAELKAAIAAFDELTEYGEKLYPDRFEFERVAGLRVTPRGSGETRIQLD